MKYQSEFPHQVLGIVCSFLFLFGRFCSCENLTNNNSGSDIDSDEKALPSEATTTETTTTRNGTLKGNKDSPGPRFSETLSGSGTASQSQSESESGGKNSLLIIGVVIFCHVVIGLALYFIFTRGKCQTKRTGATRCRVEEGGEQGENFGDPLPTISAQLARQSHNHSCNQNQTDTVTTSNEFSRGVTMIGKLQSGGIKYKMLT